MNVTPLVITPCSVARCPKPVIALGLCGAHRGRLRRHGDVQAHIPLRNPQPVRKCSIDDCRDPVRAMGWCVKHYSRWKVHGDPLYIEQIIGDDEARFWSKVNKAGPIPERRPDLGPCWVWTGDKDRDGYGRIQVGGRGARVRHWAVTQFVAPIPDGHEPDHLCFNPSCVNYETHLEVVPLRVKILRRNSPAAINARKTHCDRGHEFNEANTWIRSDGARWCKPCGALRLRERRLAEKLAEGRACPRCGADISRRSRQAAHCEPCARLHLAERDRRMDPAELREIRAVHKAIRRARKRDLFVEKVYRPKVFKRDGGICGICHKAVDPANWHLDHIRPLSRGGEHSYANTQVAHPACNQRKSASWEPPAGTVTSERADGLTGSHAEPLGEPERARSVAA